MWEVDGNYESQRRPIWVNGAVNHDIISGYKKFKRKEKSYYEKHINAHFAAKLMMSPIKRFQNWLIQYYENERKRHL